MEENNRAIWPGWETVRLIGRGSFGAVYEIERDVLGEKEKAALKVISIPQSDSDISEMYSDGYDEESITSTFKEHLKSIVAEYSLMRKLNGSANVVNCDDVRYVQHDDGFGWDIFIKMELLMPLTAALPAEVSEEQVIKIAKDLCRALVQCKQFGIIHRDIKPQNIFVSPLGDYKLGDFGIAKTVEKTSGGTKIGTYKYMAPEVYNNQPYGAGADIYSLGLVLYWLLNERRMPFLPLPPEKLRAGLEEQARLRRFNGEQIPAPVHGSEELKQIVLKACAYDPRDRFQSAEEMLQQLNRLAESAWISAGKATDALQLEQTSDDGTVGVWHSDSKTPISGTDALQAQEGTVGVYRSTQVTTEPEEDSTVGAFSNPAFDKGQSSPGTLTPDKSKKRKTRLIAVIVAIAVILLIVLLLCHGKETGTTVTPVPSSAPTAAPTSTPLVDEPIPTPWVEGDWDWSLENGVLTISGTGNMRNYGNSGEMPWNINKNQITRIVIEDGITGIGNLAFMYCSNVTSIELPESVTYIGDDAFAVCSSLTSFEIPENVTSIGHGAFSACENLSEIRVSSGNHNYTSVDGVLFSKDGTVLLDYPAGKSEMSYVIPDGVMFIGEWAFSSCRMTSIKIPGSVVSIGAGAFEECLGLTSLEIPEGVTYIGGRAFFACEGLTNVELPESVTFIGDQAFVRCNKLSNLKIPKGVTFIGEWAFYNCSSLSSVKIPESVSSIGDEAFCGCFSLTAIYYGGTQAQWSAITMGEGNDPLSGATIHYDSN